MKFVVLILFAVIVAVTVPCQAQTISLNLIAPVDVSPSSDVEPVKVFTLDAVSEHPQPTRQVATTTRSRTVTRSTELASAPILRVAPIRRAFGVLRRGPLRARLGSCSY